eukprot:TRINITY_DN18949_c0_g1_i1.p1 TRINITY_DN18949_c0_g1~~TRINITY_DN18949_c0_g1_i1.p1  ORF type:complete len:1026 (+),score=142.68 TRINITY_DN18949_c0_g1_i1:304-3078(+)
MARRRAGRRAAAAAAAAAGQQRLDVFFQGRCASVAAEDTPATGATKAGDEGGPSANDDVGSVALHVRPPASQSVDVACAEGEETDLLSVSPPPASTSQSPPSASASATLSNPAVVAAETIHAGGSTAVNLGTDSHSPLPTATVAGEDTDSSAVSPPVASTSQSPLSASASATLSNPAIAVAETIHVGGTTVVNVGDDSHPPLPTTTVAGVRSDLENLPAIQGGLERPCNLQGRGGGGGGGGETTRTKSRGHRRLSRVSWPHRRGRKAGKKCLHDCVDPTPAVEHDDGSTARGGRCNLAGRPAQHDGEGPGAKSRPERDTTAENIAAFFAASQQRSSRLPPSQPPPPPEVDVVAAGCEVNKSTSVDACSGDAADMDGCADGGLAHAEAAIVDLTSPPSSPLRRGGSSCLPLEGPRPELSWCAPPPQTPVRRCLVQQYSNPTPPRLAQPPQLSRRLERQHSAATPPRLAPSTPLCRRLDRRFSNAEPLSEPQTPLRRRLTPQDSHPKFPRPDPTIGQLSSSASCQQIPSLTPCASRHDPASCNSACVTSSVPSPLQQTTADCTSSKRHTTRCGSDCKSAEARRKRLRSDMKAGTRFVDGCVEVNSFVATRAAAKGEVSSRHPVSSVHASVHPHGCSEMGILPSPRNVAALVENVSSVAAVPHTPTEVDSPCSDEAEASGLSKTEAACELPAPVCEFEDVDSRLEGLHAPSSRDHRCDSGSKVSLQETVTPQAVAAHVESLHATGKCSKEQAMGCREVRSGNANENFRRCPERKRKLCRSDEASTGLSVGRSYGYGDDISGEVDDARSGGASSELRRGGSCPPDQSATLPSRKRRHLGVVGGPVSATIVAVDISEAPITQLRPSFVPLVSPKNPFTETVQGGNGVLATSPPGKSVSEVVKRDACRVASDNMPLSQLFRSCSKALNEL